MKRCKAVVIISLVVLLVALASQCWGTTSEWTNRPGTVGNALSSDVQDGASVYLDAVIVDKIHARQTPKYFTVRECFDAKSKIVVNVAPPVQLRHGQTIDVSGVLIRLRDGSRAIGNASVFAYLSKDDNILYHGPLIKGPWNPTPWPYKTNLSPTSIVTATSLSSVSTLSDNPTPPGEPSTDSGSGPIYCATIADAKAAYSATERILVELRCRPLENPTSGQFTLKEGGSSDSIPVYYTNASALLATDRINKIVGTIQKDVSNNYWIEVNAGPNWQSQDVAGSVQASPSGSIAWAKTFADGTTLPTDGRAHALELKSVAWCDGSYLYVEETSRSCGVRLDAPLPPDDNSYLAAIDGTIYKPTDGSETYISGMATYTPAESKPRPLGMNNKSLTQGFDLWGLLVTVWGNVTAVNSTEGYIYIDDGSGLSDGTQTDSVDNVGLRVLYSDSYYPSVGDYAIVSGPLGTAYDYTTYTYVKCIRSRGLLDATLFPPPAPDSLVAMAGNGIVDVSWQKMNAASFNIYRSSSETGTYSYIGESSGTSYRDSTLTNATTYWYKVSAVNGDSESPKAGPVSAAPSASTPIVAINSATIDTNGLLTLQCSGSCSAGEPVYTLNVDDEAVWVFSQSQISSIVYDTTQLSNGSHKFELAATYGNYCSIALQSLNVQNFISEFNVPDDMCALQPISAKFQTSTAWTLTITQGTTTLYSTSGSGDSMESSWDAGATSGDFTVTLSANGKSRTVKSRKNSGGIGGDYYAWSSVYVEDKDDTTEGNFQYMHNYAVSALQSKYGVSLYSGRIQYDSQWQSFVLDDILANNDIKPNIFVFSGHGAPNTTNPKQPIWHGVLSGCFTSSSYGAGSGLNPFWPNFDQCLGYKLHRTRSRNRQYH